MPLSLSTVGRASLCLLAIGLSASQPRAALGPVKTTTGLVLGTSGSAEGVTAYLGIPYAAPRRAIAAGVRRSPRQRGRA